MRNASQYISVCVCVCMRGVVRRPMYRAREIGRACGPRDGGNECKIHTCPPAPRAGARGAAGGGEGRWCVPWAHIRIHIPLGSTAFSRAALEPAFRGSLASLGTHGRRARAPAMMARNMDCIRESATTNYRGARRNRGLAGPPAGCKGPAGGVEPEQDGARIQVHARHRDCRSHADRRLRPEA